MTAPESRPRSGPRTPSEDTLRLMREAVLALWRDARSGEAPIESAVDRLCSEAHGRGLAAEDVILAVKALLGGMPELRESTRREDAVRLQDVLVTRCIKAYYRA